GARGGLRRSRRSCRPRHRRERSHALRAQSRAAEDPLEGQDRRGDPRGLRMITKVLMPKLSDAMETGKGIKWLKKEGDAIKGGDVSAEIETDRANVEIEALGSGVLRKIVGGEGGQVRVGDMIGVIADPADDIGAVGSAPSAPAAPAPSTKGADV